MPFVAFPKIAESAAELLAMRRAERDERRRERLHVLWLLASGQAKSRLDLARQLGRNRETISRWLADYDQGGLNALLRAPQRPGPPSRGGISLPEEVQAAIRARLAQPQGERGYLALWKWARAEHAMSYSYSHFHRWVHAHLGASITVVDNGCISKKGGLDRKLRRFSAFYPAARAFLWPKSASAILPSFIYHCNTRVCSRYI